jgi:hypothetical protein
MSENTPARRANGTFLPGGCPNPGGRPREIGYVVELARERTEDAVRVLHEIALDATQPGASRVAAASALLDRGWGRAPSSIDISILAPVEAKKNLADDLTLEEVRALQAVVEMRQRRIAGESSSENNENNSVDNTQHSD